MVCNSDNSGFREEEFLNGLYKFKVESKANTLEQFLWCRASEFFTFVEIEGVEEWLTK